MEDSPEECVRLSQMERQERRTGQGEITLQALVFVVLGGINSGPRHRAPIGAGVTLGQGREGARPVEVIHEGAQKALQ